MGMTKNQAWRWASRALLALAALLALRLALALRGAGGAGEPAADAGDAARLESFRWPLVEAGTWNLFRSGAPQAPAPAAGALAARYRLAGVFLVLSDTGRSGAENRCAILDDLQAKQQYLAMEEEWLGPVQVVRVESESVVLSDGTREEILLLAASTLPGKLIRLW